MKKSRMQKGNNAGFTLVELVVVLVIIGMISALLLPGLLGYVDGVNEKACINNAKAAVTAAQSELSGLYQSGRKTSKGADRKKWAESLALPESASLSVRCGASLEDNRRAAYTIVEAVYTEEGVSVHFDGKEYVVEEAGPFPFLMFGGDSYADLELVSEDG